MLPPSQSFGSSDFSFIHSKMMSDFVPQRLLNQAFQVFDDCKRPAREGLEIS